jgi:hypothetical protein
MGLAYWLVFFFYGTIVLRTNCEQKFFEGDENGQARKKRLYCQGRLSRSEGERNTSSTKD